MIYEIFINMYSISIKRFFFLTYMIILWSYYYQKSNISTISKYLEARNREWQWRRVYIKFVTYVYQTSIYIIFALGDNEIDKSQHLDVDIAMDVA